MEKNIFKLSNSEKQMYETIDARKMVIGDKGADKLLKVLNRNLRKINYHLLSKEKIKPLSLNARQLVYAIS